MQLFALRNPPPDVLRLRGLSHRLVKVFKHDFFAATCLYEAVDPAGTDIPRVVVKFGRTQPFWGLPLDWYGQWLCGHEEQIYRRLKGVQGVPRWAGRVDDATYAIEYIDAVPLDHLDAPPAGFFDSLMAVIRRIHACGVAYCDANKRSNILVDQAGRPYVIDYQISVCLHENWLWPLRLIPRFIVARAQKADIYHILKHKRRLAPHEMSEQEDRLSRRRGGLHKLHRRFTAGWREMRRKFLSHQFKTGRLQSPTAGLEDHHQPEKETWRRKD